MVFPFQSVRLVGTRALISGHGLQAADGSLVKTLGKVGREITQEEGYATARLTALSILASLQRALGDLDRITAWTRLFGMAELPFDIPVEIEGEVEFTRSNPQVAARQSPNPQVPKPERHHARLSVRRARSL